MQPQIISLGYSVPDQPVTQEEAWIALGYSDRARHFRRFFTESGIYKRHFWMSLSRIKEMSWQEMCEEYARGAVQLSKDAVIKCLDGRDAHTIGCVVFTSCTGFAPGPTIGQHLAGEFGLAPRTEIVNLSGHGCAGGYPGLKVACDYVAREGKLALIIACELCSCSFFPERDGIPDRENDYEVLRANSIFADAASTALVGFDNDLRHPHIIDSESYFEPDYMNDLGFMWRDGRLRVLLSRRVPELAPLVVKPAVEAILERHSLSIDNIDWFIIHAAGNSVLDTIRDSLGINEAKLSLSRETLRQFGNCSSATVGITAKMMMLQDIRPGQRILVVNVGPGMFGGATLLRFGERA